jgi:TPR repeat protein
LEQAERGDPNAQLNVTMDYWAAGQNSKDISVATADYARAAYWKCRTAVQGDAAAQYVLGELFREGNGVGTDYAKAADWFLASAKQGYVPAQVALGDIDMDYGDFDDAYFWLSVGTATAEADSRKDIQSLRTKKDEAAAHLSAGGLAFQQERVRQWLREGHTQKSEVR